MANAPTALVLLADGAEEIEVVMPVDFLRRAGVLVTVAGVNGPEPVTLNVQLKFTPDCSLKEVIDKKLQFNLVICPGGVEGTKTLCESSLVKQVLEEQNARKGLIGAICAGPTALKAHGIGVGEGRKVTSHPMARATMEEGGAFVYSTEHVVVDGNLVTTRGPGTAAEWSIKLSEMLVGKEKVDEIADFLQFKC